MWLPLCYRVLLLQTSLKVSSTELKVKTKFEAYKYKICTGHSAPILSGRNVSMNDEVVQRPLCNRAPLPENPTPRVNHCYKALLNPLERLE